MKKYIVVFVTAAMLAAGLLLSGCSMRDSELVGTWVREDNPAWVTTFEANGDGSHTISWGYGTEFTWTTSRNRILWNYRGHSRMYSYYEVSGNQLSITDASGTPTRLVRR